MRSEVVGFAHVVRFVVVAALSSAVWSSAVHADSMRCGKWIANESTTLNELVTKCGQPQSRDVRKEDQYAINPNGARVKTGLQTVTEVWIYRPSSSALPMAVLIVDGEIVKLERAE